MYTNSRHHSSSKPVEKPWRVPASPDRSSNERAWNLADHDTYTEFIRDVDAEIRTIHRQLVYWLQYRSEIQFRYGTVTSRLQ